MTDRRREFQHERSRRESPIASSPMDRQATLLLALGMLIAAAALVSASGWILFIRDRRAGRSTAATAAHGSGEEHEADPGSEHHGLTG